MLRWERTESGQTVLRVTEGMVGQPVYPHILLEYMCVGNQTRVRDRRILIFPLIHSEQPEKVVMGWMEETLPWMEQLQKFRGKNVHTAKTVRR